MQQTITLKEVIDWMDTGAPFSMAFVTCNKQRDTGGEWVEVQDVAKHEYLTTREILAQQRAQPKTTSVKKPAHFENSTRNIRFPNGEIRKVHIRLIRRFNGKIVT